MLMVHCSHSSANSVRKMFKEKVINYLGKLVTASTPRSEDSYESEEDYETWP